MSFRLCLSVFVHYECSCHWTVSVKFGIENVCRENSIFFKNRIKLQANYMKTQVCFIVASNINSPWKHCCATLNTFILLTVTCSSTIHRERIVAFLLQVCLANSLQCCLLIRTLPISCTFYKRAAVNTNVKCRSNKMWERFVWPSSYYF
jgi:hypothetical protein